MQTSTVKEYLTVQMEGLRRIQRKITEVYHIGASLKDLGKKWFAFSIIELDAREMINKLND